MNFIEAQQEFQIRFYYWSTSEFEKEINQSFPILNTFENGPIWETHQFMTQINKSEQLALAKGLVKRSHPKVINLLGETFSDEEKLLLNQLDNFRSQFHVPVKTDLSSPKFKHVSKNKLRKAIEIAFTKAYGSRCFKILTIAEGWDPFFEMKFSGWIVSTSFSFGHYQSMIGYQHSIGSEAKVPTQGYPPECWPPTMRLGGSLSLLGAGFGISGQSQWVSLKKEDVEKACDMAIRCCDRFFEAVPQLLKGLEYEMIAEGKSALRLR